MELSSTLVKSLATVTNDSTSSSVSTTVYGTVVAGSSGICVQLDGSDVLTSVSDATDIRIGDRVRVSIENHVATVTENLTTPASGYTASETETNVYEYLNVDYLDVVDARIGALTANYVTVGYLTATYATIEDLTANYITVTDIAATYVTTEKLTADYITAADISAKYVTTETLTANYITATDIASKYVTTEKLTADYITATDIAAKYVTTEKLTADYITATDIAAKYVTTEHLTSNYITATDIAAKYVTTNTLTASYLTTTQLKAQYATIDLANVSVESVGTLFADVGLLTSMTVVDGYITGALNGVTINADVITAGTLSVDRLLLTGEGGIVYAINASSSGLTETELSEEQYQNYINGTCIVAQSITANQIAAETITGNEIAANTIEAGKLNVDVLSAITGNVGELTSGILKSNNYDADTGAGLLIDLDNGTITGSDLTLLATKIDNISVGGRNYIRNSETMIYTGYGIVSKDDSIAGYVGSAIVGTSTMDDGTVITAAYLNTIEANTETAASAIDGVKATMGV